MIKRNKGLKTLSIVDSALKKLVPCIFCKEHCWVCILARRAEKNKQIFCLEVVHSLKVKVSHTYVIVCDCVCVCVCEKLRVL